MIETNFAIQSTETSVIASFAKAQATLLMKHNGKPIDDNLIREHARLVCEYEHHNLLPACTFVGKALETFKGQILNASLVDETLSIGFE